MNREFISRLTRMLRCLGRSSAAALLHRPLSLVAFITDIAESSFRYAQLGDLLYGVRRTADAPERWEDIASRVSSGLRGGRCRVETAQVSPDKRHLAICSEVRTLLGFRVRQAGHALFN
jgi:hypothetical protein